MPVAERTTTGGPRRQQLASLEIELSERVAAETLASLLAGMNRFYRVDQEIEALAMGRAFLARLTPVRRHLPDEFTVMAFAVEPPIPLEIELLEIGTPNKARVKGQKSSLRRLGEMLGLVASISTVTGVTCATVVKLFDDEGVVVQASQLPQPPPTPHECYERWSTSVGKEIELHELYMNGKLTPTKYAELGEEFSRAKAELLKGCSILKTVPIDTPTTKRG